MEAIEQYFDSLGLDIWLVLQAGLILLVGTFLVSLIARFIFGKQSSFNCAVSSAIGILFIYAVTIVLHSCGARFESLIVPLPFVEISGDYLHVFVFNGAYYAQVCAQLLSTVILAFLINLAGSWLPQSKKVFHWFFFRCITVLMAMALHLLVVWLFATFLPQGIVTYAPTVLLGLLVILLLTGSLKFLVGAIISTHSPIIGGLYAFFFATAIGKQISRAMLTTGILALLVLALNYIGCTLVYIASTALIAYIPFLIILVVLWYVVCRHL